MKYKNKAIIGFASLVVIVAMVITIKSKVKVTDKEIMEGPYVSSTSEASKSSTEREINTTQDEEKTSDNESNDSSKEEGVTKNNVKVNTTRNSERYSLKNSSNEEGSKSKTSNVVSDKESSSNKVEVDTISSVFSKANNFIKDLVTGVKDELFNNVVEENNNNEDTIKYDSQDKNLIDLKENNVNKEEVNKAENNSKEDAVSSASNEKEKETNTIALANNTDKQNTFIERAINKKSTKLVDLGWVKYIVVTFNQGNMNDYDLYVLDNGSYKAISPSKVDDSGKVVKWEIDKLGYNTIKVKNKKSGEEGTYKF